MNLRIHEVQQNEDIEQRSEFKAAREAREKMKYHSLSAMPWKLLSKISASMGLVVLLCLCLSDQAGSIVKTVGIGFSVLGIVSMYWAEHHGNRVAFYGDEYSYAQEKAIALIAQSNMREIVESQERDQTLLKSTKAN